MAGVAWGRRPKRRPSPRRPSRCPRPRRSGCATPGPRERRAWRGAGGAPALAGWKRPVPCRLALRAASACSPRPPRCLPLAHGPARRWRRRRSSPSACDLLVVQARSQVWTVLWAMTPSCPACLADVRWVGLLARIAGGAAARGYRLAIGVRVRQSGAQGCQGSWSARCAVAKARGPGADRGSRAVLTAVATHLSATRAGPLAAHLPPAAGAECVARWAGFR